VVLERSEQCPDIRLDDVLDECKIAGGFSITVDRGGLTLQAGLDEQRDDRGIGAVRVLPGPEYIKITQADGMKTIGTGKNTGIQLINILADGIGRKRVTDLVLHLG